MALIESEKNLPEDIRTELGPLLKQYRELMTRENDSKKWYREKSILQYQIDTAITDVGEARFAKAHPNIAKKHDKDFTQEDTVKREEFQQDVQSQVLEAKYAKSPNWKRIEKLFVQAKSDIVSNLKSMKLDSKQKALLLERISSVKLSLPYVDSRKLGADDDCGTTQMNAFYTPSFNKFTVCAGYFNAYETDAGIYTTIAHELSHSIDSGNNANHVHYESEFMKSLEPLAGASKPPYSCDQWSKIVSKANKKLEETTTYADPMQYIYDCLAPKDNLKKIDLAELKKQAKIKSTRRLSTFADANAFVLLAQPTRSKDDGTQEGNEYYLRSDLLYGKFNDTLTRDRLLQTPESYEILNQALSCQNKKSDRATQLDKAITETGLIMTARHYSNYLSCTVNCSDLSEIGMSAESGENFADWLANRAFGDFINREKDMRTRREMIGVSSASYCVQPGTSSDPDLAAIQKKYSLEEHPEDNIRRNSIFNDRNVKLVDCTIDKKDQGFGKCEPK